MIRANPIGRFFRAATLAPDHSIGRQIRGEAPLRRPLGTGKKVLRALGAWAGLGALGGVVDAQQRIEVFNARPKIAIEPTMESESIIKVNVRGLDRNIASLNVKMGLEKGCGAKKLGKRTIDEAVQFRVDVSGMVKACDVRIFIDGKPYTFKNAFSR